MTSRVPAYRSKIVEMEMVVRKFNSFADADAADLEARASLSPQQRVAMFFEIRERSHPDDAFTQRFAPVYRVLKLEQS